MKEAILYSDNHLLVLNKRGNLLTQPNDIGRESLESLAKQWLKEEYQKSGNVFLHALHRLDAKASGIVLFAKTSKALSRLNEKMRDLEMEKKYFAIVEGRLKEETGRLEHWHFHGDYKASIYPSQKEGTKKAILSYKLIKCVENLSLIEVKLETGRYHQIRAQFAFLGHPIVGDQKYGSNLAFADDTIALHHTEMIFPHPISGERMKINAPLPAYWFSLDHKHLLESNGGLSLSI